MTGNADPTSSEADYFFDVNTSPLFTKDAHNKINILGQKQLNTLEGSSLLDIFLTKGNVVEPHYHQNAAELVYCISGAATVSLLQPFTKELLHFPITPGQVANVPQGWWHYEIATADDTHLLAIFDAPNPEVILGSDILKFTPPEVMAHTYCMDEQKWKEVTAPIQPSTYIGPYSNCTRRTGAQGRYPHQAAYIHPVYYYPPYMY
ncbi:cupin domain-containing protein [Halobacillus sp. KGW1]|uniref:cupin domain-containing protein n=1 Tax=Halobacillus sp. KGW1 TaxID=1793726 RepID=UPI0007815BBB|nr:cupin domain-containing protein [Halobacillus sp. KGW1]